ncbi:hypothetical protein [Burkholderia diffusa]|uniref:hypothetical protein n=1 Tax=Burkholderia diffusa TaxID=488732 RepID=UPI0012D97D4E|nr:hypothetical protein [Burkholderia diffusa]
MLRVLLRDVLPGPAAADCCADAGFASAEFELVTATGAEACANAEAAHIVATSATDNFFTGFLQKERYDESSSHTTITPDVLVR